MKTERRKRFSIQLMQTIGILVVVSVLLISGVLYIYFGKRLDQEFRNQIAARKGQAELILSRRFVQIKRQLQDLSTDNAIRVTLLLDAPAQLQDRLERFYAPVNGLSFYVRKAAAPLVSPTHSEQFVDALLNTPPGELPAPEAETSPLVWWFETPITSNEARLMDRMDSHINKVIELGFLRRMKPAAGQPGAFEVRRILKAFVDAQWLADFDARLATYRAQLEKPDQAEGDE